MKQRRGHGRQHARGYGRGRLATWWDHWTHPLIVTDRRVAVELQAIGDHQASLAGEPSRPR